MTPDGTYAAVLDRFEGDRAVLLLESGGQDVDDVTVERDRLPPDARHQDAVVSVTLQNGWVVGVQYDEEETERRRADAQERFDRLARRPDESDEA